MSVTSDSQTLFLPQILERRAEDCRDGWSFTFLDSKGTEQCRWSAQDLVLRARAVAARLNATTRPGEPVLLVFQAGPEFLAAFMGCLWSGRLATPINPPRRNRLIERLVAVAVDSEVRVALTTTDMLPSIDEWRHSSVALSGLQWIASDSLVDQPGLKPATLQPSDIAFLQYTSGSTAQPKGVQVSHGNLVEDLARMQQAWLVQGDSTLVSWLPAFHDLGLIFGLLQPLYSGCASVQMAPNAFLQKPGLWLQALSRYRGTHSAAPSFAYDLCVRRISQEEAATLDLSHMVMTMNAAEPINPVVLNQFVERFESVGFKANMFAPAYGLAESTLAVTANPAGIDPVMRRFCPEALADGRIELVEDMQATQGRWMSGSGRALPDVEIAIVDPETAQRCPPGRVGEIWVSGPTIASGYWRRPEATTGTFGVRIQGDDHAGGFLRTGDLGAVVDLELFVTGRIKDLIILGGANFYPHDIERVAQDAHDALRRDNGAAFSVSSDDEDGGREQVVLVQELERSHRNDPTGPIFQCIVEAVWQKLELPLAHVVLVAPGTVLRTSSGKIQRLANRRAYLDGTIPVIARWERRHVPASTRMASEQTPTQSPAPTSSTFQAGELRRWLAKWLSDRLGLPVSMLEAQHGFAELGLDSIGSTELAFALAEKLGCCVPETIAYDHPTIERLVAYLAAQDDPIRPADRVSPTEDGTSNSGSDLDELLTALERGVL